MRPAREMFAYAIGTRDDHVEHCHVGLLLDTTVSEEVGRSLTDEPRAQMDPGSMPNAT